MRVFSKRKNFTRQIKDMELVIECLCASAKITEDSLRDEIVFSSQHHHHLRLRFTPVQQSFLSAIIFRCLMYKNKFPVLIAEHDV